MKRIIICMDGTWQTLNQQRLTNIGIIARSVAHKETLADGSHIHQQVIYTKGVGSSIGALERLGFFGSLVHGVNRIFGGMFGEGLEDGIVDTYLRLAFDYEEGDEIFIFGFSRGAFAARRLSGFINIAGIVSRRHAERAREGFRLYYRAPGDDAPEDARAAHAEEARQFRMKYGKGARNEDGTRRASDAVPPITYVGVFDTVAQRGAGEVLRSFFTFRNRNRFRFRNLCIPENVMAARHAVAIDECRAGFPCQLWEDIGQSNERAGQEVYAQKWFVGYHGDVGGGENEALSAAALKWVADGARQAGLRFYATYGDDASPLEEAVAKLDAGARVSRPPLLGIVKPINWPIRNREIWADRSRPTLEQMKTLLDEHAYQRACQRKPPYRPGALRPFRRAVKQLHKEMRSNGAPRPKDEP
ncbi:MAG: phospholipase effector Tle1 domain-containing protein [Hyphomonas sp.]